MLFSRAKKCGFSSKIRDIPKGKSMKNDFRDLPFSLTSLWKCPMFQVEIPHIFALENDISRRQIIVF